MIKSTTFFGTQKREWIDKDISRKYFLRGSFFSL